MGTQQRQQPWMIRLPVLLWVRPLSTIAIRHHHELQTLRDAAQCTVSIIAVLTTSKMTIAMTLGNAGTVTTCYSNLHNRNRCVLPAPNSRTNTFPESPQ